MFCFRTLHSLSNSMIGASTGSQPLGLLAPGDPAVIDVTVGLPGYGTPSDPWILTETAMMMCISRLNWTTRTIFFRPGIYFSFEPIRIDFAAAFPTIEGRNMLREGVAFRGVARASVICFPQRMRGFERPLFQVCWSRSGQGPGAQTPLFFWEFTGLNIKGDVDHELVRFGGTDIEETPWNSCVFQVCVNNGYIPDSDPRELSDDESATGPGRGIHFMRALESNMDVVATCAHGIAAVFDTCEFCTLKGSFSNAECDVPTVENGGTSHTGKAIRPLSRGLYLIDCVGLTTLSINLEVCFCGITLERGCRGINFSSIISNNCDARGSIFDIRQLNDDAISVVQVIARRQAIQGNHQVQALGPVKGTGVESGLKILHVVE